MRSRTDNGEPLLTGSDIALTGCAALVVLGFATILFGGAISGLLFEHQWAWPPGPALGPTVIGVVTNPSTPAAGYPPNLRAAIPGPSVFWGTIGVLAAVEAALAGWVAAAASARRAEPGMATRRQLQQAMTARQHAIQHHDRHTDRHDDRGHPFGTALRVPVALRGEDSTLVVAPARAGKTTRLAAGRIVDAPGPVVATSTKADLVALTGHTPRTGQQGRQQGRSLVFDPDRLLDWPAPCRWDAVAGCDDVREALTRARAMVAARPLRGDRNSSFFEGASETVLRCLLHAAALDQLTMRDVLTWARDFDDDQPYQILRSHPDAAPGWVDDLRKFCRAGAPETIGSTAMTLGLVLKSLADPHVLDLVCPTPGDGFDIDAFVRGHHDQSDSHSTASSDRLYLVSEGGDGVSTAPLVTAFAAAVVSAARRHSQTLPGGRLNPPLTLVLDEAANVAPLPDLPTLMADGGGRGITTWTFVQSFSQLRSRWGRDGADTIWGASTAKILLGGCTEADDLERISKVVGDRWASRRSHTTRGGLLPTGEHSTSLSRERERILPVQDLARLPDGTGLLLYRSTPPTLVRLPAWWERPDAHQFRHSLAVTSHANGPTRATGPTAAASTPKADGAPAGGRV